MQQAKWIGKNIVRNFDEYKKTYQQKEGCNYENSLQESAKRFQSTLEAVRREQVYRQHFDTSYPFL